MKLYQIGGNIKKFFDLKKRVTLLEKENLLLRAENISFKNLELKEKTLIDMSLGDPTPNKTAQRKTYVSSVAGFYKDFYKKKLEYMISKSHNLLEEDGDRDIDLKIKGVIYAFREIMRWGESMINEQIANQTDISDDEIQTLKDKIKE